MTIKIILLAIWNGGIWLRAELRNRGLVDCAKIKAFNLLLMPLAECGYPVLSGLLFKDLKHKIPEKLKCGR